MSDVKYGKTDRRGCNKTLKASAWPRKKGSQRATAVALCEPNMPAVDLQQWLSVKCAVMLGGRSSSGCIHDGVAGPNGAAPSGPV
jgi:hypothetical protein